MWRAFFLAIGAFVALLGTEALVIERAYFKPEFASSDLVGRGEIVPPEWAPWSLMAAGAVVILYSFTIPKRVQG